MKTIDIKGKEYVMINERILFFRESELYDGWSLTSEIVSHVNGAILIKAIITDQNGFVVASGMAQEKDGDGFINKTSYVENCETSAWGRALGNLGIGIDTSIASAEEVQNAINNQNKPKPEPKKVTRKLLMSSDATQGIAAKTPLATMMLHFDMTADQQQKYAKALDNGGN